MWSPPPARHTRLASQPQSHWPGHPGRAECRPPPEGCCVPPLPPSTGMVLIGEPLAVLYCELGNFASARVRILSAVGNRSYSDRFAKLKKCYWYPNRLLDATYSRTFRSSAAIVPANGAVSVASAIACC